MPANDFFVKKGPFPLSEIVKIIKVTSLNSHFKIINLVRNFFKIWQKSLRVLTKKDKDNKNVKI